MKLLFSTVVFCLFISAAFCQTYVTTLPWSNDLESEALCATNCAATCNLSSGFSNDPTANRDWLVDNQGTGSPGTGPGPQGFNTGMDHNPGTLSGKYLLCETTSPCQTGADTWGVISPYFDLSLYNDPILSFWYHLYGANVGNMHFDVDTTQGQGAWVTDFIPAWTDDIDLWQEQVISLAVFSQDSVRFRIRYEGNTGFQGDAALDDFFLYQFPPVDLLLVSVDNPTSGCALDTNEAITFTLQQLGASTLAVNDTIVASFTYSSPTVTSTTITEDIILTSALGPNAFLTYTFTGVVNFSAVDTFSIVAAVTHTDDTLFNNNDSIFDLVESLPAINGFPYFEDFEGGQGGWLDAGVGNSSWAFGEPNKNEIVGAASGTKAWVTGGLGTGEYNVNEASIIESPCFNFTNIAPDPWISLSAWWDNEYSWDGARLEYATAPDGPWTTLGQDGDPHNWYNDSTINAYGSGTQPGWSGTSFNFGSQGWVTAKHELPTALVGESNVFFRVRFQSDVSVTFDGFAFDNVAISTPPTLDLGNDTLVCGNFSLESGFTTGTFDWSTGSTDPNVLLTNNNLLNDTVLVELTYTDSLGFCDTDTIQVMLMPSPIVSLPNDTTTCPNASIQLDAAIGSANPYSILWSTGETLADSITVSTANSYVISVTDNTSNCVASDSVQVHQTLPVQLPIDTTYCEGALTVLNATYSGAVSYLWSTGSTLSLEPINASGLYSVTMTDTLGCITSDSTNVAFTNPLVFIGNDTTICTGATLTLATPGSMNITNYLWNDNSTNATLNVTTAGNYTLSVTDQFGCAAEDEIDVALSDGPTVDLGPDTTVCIFNFTPIPLVVDAGGGLYIYQWSNGSTAQSQAITVAGSYTVTVTDLFGCTDSDNIVVNYELCVGINERAADAGITLYPNPSNGQIALEIVGRENASLEMTLLNAQGQFMQSFQATQLTSNHLQSIDLTDYPKGIYFVRLNISGVNHVHRISIL